MRAAHGLLAPIYDWFTEGFDTPDLQEAKSRSIWVRRGRGPIPSLDLSTEVGGSVRAGEHLRGSTGELRSCD
jgi:hypothetical protein